MSQPGDQVSRRAVISAVAVGVAASLGGCASSSSGFQTGVAAEVAGIGRRRQAAPVRGTAAPPLGLLGEGQDEGGFDPRPAATPLARPVWTPNQPLPAASPGRRVNIVLSPHPDDETLSMGVWIANAIGRGERVIVVCLTDGRTTGAVTAISARLGRQLSRDEIGAARIRELRSAVAALGVAAEDVYLAHLDGDDTQGGSLVTQPEAAAVIQAFARQFPSATYATMSYVAERHPDHLAAGRALWQAVQDGIVASVEFAVSRLWWQLPCPPVSVVRPATVTARGRVLSAGGDYDVWDPARQRYSIGWTSVHGQFLDLMADPVDHLHPWAPFTSRTGPAVVTRRPEA